MKVGDFAICTSVNTLWIFSQSDEVSCIVNASNNIYDPPHSRVPWSIQNPNIWIVNPTTKEIQAIMKMRAFPAWVLQIVNSSQNQVAAAVIMGNGSPTSPQAQGTTQNTQPIPGYPIGTLFMGTGRAGNIWIVNKQNSRDMSLLWDGVTKRFCGSELERQSKIDPAKPRMPLDLSLAMDEISKQIHPKARQAIPQWAQQMILAPKTKPGHFPITKPQPKQTAQALASFIKHLDLKAPVQKTVDMPGEMCEHEFVMYSGFREVYEYCTKCDKKRNVAK